MKESPISKAYRILEEYCGTNNQILYYKRLNELHKLILTEDGFETEYIIKNKDYISDNVNKIVKISKQLGEKLQEKYEIDFTPEKLRITTIIGEMKNSYHCYAQYRNSIPPTLMFLSKKQILTPIHVVDYKSIDYSSKIALIIGNEAKGISRLVSKKCDFLVKIPMYGKTNSLNASVAAGIMIYEAIRNRK